MISMMIYSLRFYYFLLPLLCIPNASLSVSSSQSPLPHPISLPPTQFWDGNDGPWSTFALQVGLPSQPLNLLPSTSGNTIGPILRGACPASEPENCATKRGRYFFDSNASTTWNEIGIYELLLTEERALGLAANGSFGFDRVVLGPPGTQNTSSLDQTIVGAFEDTSIYVGTLGLYPPAVNLSNITTPHLSFMGTLRNQSKIPSTLWSYTAGASYRQPTAFGSLTLGGYDTTRFIPNNISFSFGPDQSRDLVVGLQGIHSGTYSLLPNGIYAFLDSLVPDLWLPIEACQLFERAFGLSYNSTAQRYFVNETLHQQLSAQSPKFTFTLGPSSAGGSSLDIVMQYESFDLAYEDVNSGYQSRYFPLRQAHNSSMYTLGRTFFQDSYVIADYDRANFSVSQVIFPNNSNAQNIIAVRPPGPESDPPSRKLASASIGGITVSALVLILSAGALLYWRRRSRKRRQSTQRLEQDEKSPDSEKAELSSSNTRAELADTVVAMPELGQIGVLHAELNAEEVVGAELLSKELPRAELPGTNYDGLDGGRSR